MSQSETRRKTEKLFVYSYRIESVVFFEALFEYCGLVFRQSQLLPRCFSVFVVADPSRRISLDLDLITDRISLAPLSAQARQSAVWRRDPSFFLAVGCRWKTIHIDSFEERSCLAFEDLTTPLCNDSTKRNQHSKPRTKKIMIFVLG